MLGVAQKQPGGLPPQLATRVQHSPPVCVWQQHRTSATFAAPIVTGIADVARHIALSACLAHAVSAIAAETKAALTAKAMTAVLNMAARVSSDEIPRPLLF
jgi:hypothetical protein